MPNYVGIFVQVHGLDRWGRGLTHEEVRKAIEAAVRLQFPQIEYEGDIVVEIEEHSGECAEPGCGGA